MKEIVDEEQYWIDAFRKRDERALSYYFEKHYKSLCYFTGRLIQDDGEAEDIVSGCFVKLWKSEHDAKNGDSIKAFLYITCRNACFDFLRKLKVRTVAQQNYFEQLEQSDETILVKIVKTELLCILEKEIELLPDGCREVFKLFYYHEKGTKEVMKLTNLNEKAVRYQKAKAIELLKTSLLKRGITEGLYLALLFLLDKR